MDERDLTLPLSSSSSSSLLLLLPPPPPTPPPRRRRGGGGAPPRRGGDRVRLRRRRDIGGEIRRGSAAAADLAATSRGPAEGVSEKSSGAGSSASPAPAPETERERCEGFRVQCDATVAAHRVPFPTGEELDERARVLHGVVPPLLPVHPDSAVWGNITWGTPCHVTWSTGYTSPSPWSRTNGTTPTVSGPGRRRAHGHFHGFPDPRLYPVGARARTAAPGGGHGDVGVHRLLPGGDRGNAAKHGVDTAATANGDDGVRHVLKASMDDDRHDYYALGLYDAAQNVWVPDEPDMDTFYDPVKKRRLLWGWIGETDSERADILKGWASLQAVPRSVLFDVKTGSNLIQWPVEEIESLRMNRTDFSGITIDTGSFFRLNIQKATQLDIVAEFEIPKEALEAVNEADIGYNCSTSGGAAGRGALGPFGLLVLADKKLTEQTAVYFYVSRKADGGLKTHFCQDEVRSSKANDIVKRVVGSSVPVLDGETLSLRILVDHSIVESFAQGGRSCITSRVYPTEAIYNAAGVYLFNNATNAPVTAKTLTVWEMSSSFNQPYPAEA
uniref:Glycosyl hydrolase family 32 C-terminal domain-containing protein n=1 Tax=Ananas comosus var. bracteatus TaxID=296719 RepID=A0A6V7PJW9_ANACO|nr:unnamed protein product [Ananas comosus var. bracteatus]